ncbi:hypothetical protein PM082_016793 [Marasmius tenuissimus]|nr:hypothetical protein PM082_016793 [Marasmius tenuissimus]
MAQLRAFNDSHHVPIIIFNEGGSLRTLRILDADNSDSKYLVELVSVQHFLKHNRYSVQARCYFHFHAIAWALFPGASFNERLSWASLVHSESYNESLGRLWFRPQTGALCFGPPGPNPVDGFSPNMYLSWPYVEHPICRSFCPELPPLPLDACHHDTILFNYIIRNVPERPVVLQVSVINARSGYGPFHRGMQLWREQLKADRWTAWGEPFPLKRVLEIPVHAWTHKSRYATYGRILPPRAVRNITQSGGTRFTFTRRLRAVQFKFTERLTGDRFTPRQELWLTQAGWVFSRLGISRGDWASCSIATLIELRLTAADSFKPEDLEDLLEDFDPPCYLFVPPPPQLPDGAPDIETWLREENLYYYSYDSAGGSVITEGERISLRLPSFTSEFCVEYVYWDTEAYDFMEKWERAKGFDYNTMDYAKSLGFPIFDVTIPQDQGHFEDLIDSSGIIKMDIDADMVEDTSREVSEDGQIDLGRTNLDDSSSDMDVDIDT